MKLEDVQRREAVHFLPVVNRLPVAIAEGRGSRVVDIAGREYLDLTAGWGVTAIGHCHPRLVAAIAEQAARLMQTTNLFYTLPQLDLCETLAAATGEKLSRSFFTSSGAEAMDGALKLAHRATHRRKFVSTTGSFHGRTLGALQVIGQAKHRDPYRELLQEQVCVPFGDAEAAVKAIDRDTAAFVVEPIQGEGGVNVPPRGYLARIRARCDEVGALLLLDEIQTGIGRTGRMFAYEHEDVVPDVMTLGKHLGGGFPIAAFLCTEDVAATVTKGDHGGTYAGNPLACAAANATLAVVCEDKLVERAADLGARVLGHLQRFAETHPELASNARGRGLLLGLTLSNAEAAASLSRRALDVGVLVNVTAGNVLRLFPALNMPEDELFLGLERVLGLVADR
jgi:acetylornithine/N-succinyldiaminopimelate aminotransferase